MLSKDCNLRDTRSGEIAVVVNHIVTEDEEGGQEMVTLMIFEAQAAGPAKIVSDFFSIEEPSALEIQQKTSAMARAKLTTQPMNRHMLRHVHQEFMRDLMGRPGVGRAGARRTAEDVSEEATIAKEIIGRTGRVLLQFREGDFEEFEIHAITVNAVEGMATKVALVFHSSRSDPSPSDGCEQSTLSAACGRRRDRAHLHLAQHVPHPEEADRVE